MIFTQDINRIIIHTAKKNEANPRSSSRNINEKVFFDWKELLTVTIHPVPLVLVQRSYCNDTGTVHK